MKRRELARSGLSAQGWGAGYRAPLGLILLAAEAPCPRLTVKDAENSELGSQKSWGWAPPLCAQGHICHICSCSGLLSFHRGPGPECTGLLSLAPDLRRLSTESSQERPWDARRKVSRSTSCCALQLPVASLCHLALLVCIYRLNHPYPACTMFPKHSLITINQRAGSATARPCEHLVNDGKRLPNGQLGSGWDGETWVLSRLRRQRHCHEPSGMERRSLVFDNEK